jgi:hypothetical protein
MHEPRVRFTAATILLSNISYTRGRTPLLLLSANLFFPRNFLALASILYNSTQDMPLDFCHLLSCSLSFLRLVYI